MWASAPEEGSNEGRVGPQGLAPAKTTYQVGERFEFGLILLGKAVDYLPYFVLAFRELARQGFGLNRARCELEEVRVAPGFSPTPGSAGERRPLPTLPRWHWERAGLSGKAFGLNFAFPDLSIEES